MIKGKTKTGFAFEIDERVKNDWRLISNIALAESDNISERVKGTAALVSLLLGKNEKKFMEHISKINDGYIPMDAVMNELVDMIQNTEEIKN